jgi:hypothetical protein
MVGSNAISTSTPNVSKRIKVMSQLIAPWMILAGNHCSPQISLTPIPPMAPFNGVHNPEFNLWYSIDPNDPQGRPSWEVWWDQLDEDMLLQYAPFKLMAIVNRLDLRGNNAYGGNLTNAGETRFIFTLLDPATGKPPFHDNIEGGSDLLNSGKIDWVGMNVILEYGNPFTDNCELRDFAQDWFDLSSHDPTTNEYLDLLESITSKVITANKGGTKNKNASALNQIRTNEKIFFDLEGFQNGTGFWQPPNWELRQFELNNNDGLLHLAPVSNTPQNGANTFSGGNSLDITNFIYNSSINKVRAQNGVLNLPEPYLAGSADISMEMFHFLGFNWNQPNIYNAATYDVNADNPDYASKEIRHQVSLNTCQGCHGGENKTNFTQVFPRGYGEEANYWDAIPSYVNYGLNGSPNFTIDGRSFSGEINPGTTLEMSTLTDEDNHNLDEKYLNQRNQVVSPMLTGRRYSSEGNGWQDDELDDANVETPLGIPYSPSNLSDEFMNGFYWVNDPTNESSTIPVSLRQFGEGGSFPQLHTQRWGFNDLERRKKDLCFFLSMPCGNLSSPIRFFTIMEKISFIPLPFRGH